MSRSGPLLDGDPARVGDYEIVGRLGAGGMGVVYLARGADGRQVAVKLVHTEIAGDPEFRRRFRDEVARARQVPPFCTAEVVDADPDAARPYLVVEYVEGPTLDEEVRQRGPLNPANLHGLAIGVATALTAIHGAGVIHRDLKPGNVLLAPGSPKVIDFGIAHALEAAQERLTRTGVYLGTVNYMAPERFAEEAGPITAAADVFAWGCVVVFAGTGRAPFDGGTAIATMARIISQPPRLDGLPEGPLRRLAGRALAPDPASRPTARELLDLLLGNAPAGALDDRPELRSASAEASVAARTVTDVPAATDVPAETVTVAGTGPAARAGERVTGPAPRRRTVAVLTAAVAVLALALLGGAGFVLQQSSRAGEQPLVPAPAAPPPSAPSTAPTAGGSAPPSPSASVTPSSVPAATRTTAAPAAPKPSAAAPAPDVQPPVEAAPGTRSGYGPYLIHNLRTGLCADLDGTAGGTPTQPVLQDVCRTTTDDNQEFSFVPRGTDGSGRQFYWIRNTDDDLCLDVDGTGSVPRATPVVERECYGEDNQDYRLEPKLTSGGRQYYWLVNTASGLCLDVYGKGDGGSATHLTLVNCVSGDDHEWALVRRSDW
ncbi:serine/threonine protein kinase [Catenuloplanes indicus]|uniref:Protein kinase domain-containing protein n=1 Tax=Catenuloplanes indicus TaxID=137267 RepID=A0AAE4B272_9ACTN|nr:serine/threonine protein kinase [Catenuloplanes indicus]MDQ0371389.1 hypothetical protein [Catenuloplanes indicus]